MIVYKIRLNVSFSFFFPPKNRLRTDQRVKLLYVSVENVYFPFKFVVVPQWV